MKQAANGVIVDAETATFVKSHEDSEELRQDIRYAVAWMRDEYRDVDRPFSPELVVRTVVNAVRAVNASYTDGVVLAELEKLTPEFTDVFDALTGGAFSLTVLKHS